MTLTVVQRCQTDRILGGVPEAAAVEIVFQESLNRENHFSFISACTTFYFSWVFRQSDRPV
jgi:hypothetical protein